MSVNGEARVRRVVGSVLSGFAVTAALLVTPESAQAASEPVSIRGSAYCTAFRGTWEVHYAVVNDSPATVTIASTVDAVTGAALTPTRTELPSSSAAEVVTTVAGSATSTGLTVRFRRSDQSQPARLDKLLVLPAGCAVSPATPCVTAANARYKHTLDVTRGIATVELVGPRLCAGEFDGVSLGVTTANGYFYDSSGRGINSATTKVSMRVNLPPCAGELRLSFSPTGGPVEDPRWDLGGTAAPGNHSSGPVGRQPVLGPACRELPTVSLIPQCDGTFTASFSNGAAANLPTHFWYGEMAGEMSVYFRLFHLGPGESTTIVIRPAQPMNTVYANSSTVQFVRVWQMPAQCRHRPPPSTPRPPVPRR